MNNQVMETLSRRIEPTMLAEARRRLLLDLIARRGFATLDDLVASVGASESTIRRDLEALDRDGAIRRTHGGAVVSGDMRVMPALDDRIGHAIREKRAIGLAAARLIKDGETVLLDGGTTTLEVARALAGRPVQVVTNSLPIATLLAASPQTDLILLGGYVYPRTGVALGPLAISALKEIRVRKTIMGAGGIVAEGVYNSNSLLVETERAMMACAQEVILVADSSKFGHIALAWLADLSALDRIIADDGLPAAHREMLKQQGVPLELAPLEPESGKAAPRAEVRMDAPHPAANSNSSGVRS